MARCKHCERLIVIVAVVLLAVAPILGLFAISYHDVRQDVAHNGDQVATLRIVRCQPSPRYGLWIKYRYAPWGGGVRYITWTAMPWRGLIWDSS